MIVMDAKWCFLVVVVVVVVMVDDFFFFIEGWMKLLATVFLNVNIFRPISENATFSTLGFGALVV